MSELLFFDLSKEEQSALIKRASGQKDISDVIIEKDLWLCWLLEKLFALPVQMAFKGGTSLSKAFNLIKRFSEDVDITIDYRNFEQELDLENISRTQLKKVSDRLKKQLKVYVEEKILPYLQKQITKSFPKIKNKFEIILSSDGEKLEFYYPSVLINTSKQYLRDHVLIEFGIRNSIEPCGEHQITPYLELMTNEKIILPKPNVNILSPLRTFWEKITLIHVECQRDRIAKTPERLSRHWYDLFMLYNSEFGKQALLHIEILESVLQHKKAFFNASYAHYDDCISGKLCLIPKSAGQKSLTNDFRKMIEAGMFHEQPVSFTEIIKSLGNLESTINQMKFTKIKHKD